MTNEEQKYLLIGRSLAGSEESQMFGKPCFKIFGKAFTCFYENSMVFKLKGNTHKEALSLNGSNLFDPSGKNRPMKEWVQVPFEHSEKWHELANDAYNYIRGDKI